MTVPKISSSTFWKWLQRAGWMLTVVTCLFTLNVMSRIESLLPVLHFQYDPDMRAFNTRLSIVETSQVLLAAEVHSQEKTDDSIQKEHSDFDEPKDTRPRRRRTKFRSIPGLPGSYPHGK